MVNLFRPKTMRRMAVFMALVAPIVYLFGSLFTALAGAHGQMVFAEPVYVQEWQESDVFQVDGLNKFTVENDQRAGFMNGVFSTVKTFYGSYNGAYFTRAYFVSSDTFKSFDLYNGEDLVVRLGYFSRASVSDTWSLSLTGGPWVFIGSYEGLMNYAGNFSKEIAVSVPSDTVPENAGAYSDYIFKNFFAKDNFLVEWGRDAISETPYGFAPFGYFWRYLDTNILHLSTEQVGLMAYGYMYYAAHVLLFDVGFMLVTFFLSFIQKVGDKIGGEER